VVPTAGSDHDIWCVDAVFDRLQTDPEVPDDDAMSEQENPR
jgi:hypothetical protein